MNENTKKAFFLLRFALGWLIFYAGWIKVITFFTDTKDWSAAGFLGNLHGPLAGFFAGMAGNPMIDYLNAYGLLLVGLTLMLGILVRWAAFWGVVLMILYYLAGFPPEHAFLMDDHLLYALVLVALAAVGAGRFWGLDQAIEASTPVAKNRWLLKLLG